MQPPAFDDPNNSTGYRIWTYYFFEISGPGWVWSYGESVYNDPFNLSPAYAAVNWSINAHNEAMFRSQAYGGWYSYPGELLVSGNPIYRNLYESATGCTRASSYESERQLDGLSQVFRAGNVARDTISLPGAEAAIGSAITRFPRLPRTGRPYLPGDQLSLFPGEIPHGTFPKLPGNPVDHPLAPGLPGHSSKQPPLFHANPDGTFTYPPGTYFGGDLLDRLTGHPDSHTIGRHGPAVTDQQLMRRAWTGQTPDGQSGRVPPFASKFHGYCEMTIADQAAMADLPNQIAANAGAWDLTYTVETGYNLGSGYRRPGSGNPLTPFQGPLEYYPQFTKVTVVVAYDPVSGTWRYIAMYPSL